MAASSQIDVFHIFAPPIVGIFFTVCSHFDDKLAKIKLSKFLAGKKELHPDTRDIIIRLVSSAIVLVTFMANTLVFWANCLIGFEIFPDTNTSILIEVVFNAFVWLGLLYEILFLLVRYEIIDLDEIHHKGRSIGEWLKIQQIGFVIVTIVYFSIGFTANTYGFLR